MKNVPRAHTAINARTPTALSASIHRECGLCVGRTGSTVIFRSDPLVVLDMRGGPVVVARVGRIALV
jgi:hypothetical protein